jgi:hypothetical protein
VDFHSETFRPLLALIKPISIASLLASDADPFY